MRFSYHEVIHQSFFKVRFLKVVSAPADCHSARKALLAGFKLPIEEELVSVVVYLHFYLLNSNKSQISSEVLSCSPKIDNVTY